MIKEIAKKITNFCYKVIKKILKKVFQFKIVKINPKKIVFDNFVGKGYGCNPKYIAEELIRQNVDCDMVWLVKDLSIELPPQIRKVRYGGIKACYELATAKIWVDNVRCYKGMRKKKGQFYIQTWHAPLGFKKVEAEVEDKLTKSYVKDAKYDGKIIDLFPVNNEYMANLIRKYFWYDGEVSKIGLPRNDIIGNPTKEVFEKVYKYFGIDESKKIVVYAPTFRTNGKIDAYKFDYNKVTECLSKIFKEEFVMLIRLHPNVSSYGANLSYAENILNASDYPDIQEILAVADVAITDYSSIMFDFSMFGKQVFLLMKDIEEYKKQERDLEFDLEELPFPIAYNENDLCNNIKKFSKDNYKESCNRFYNKIGLVNTNNASVEIVKIIKDKMQEQVL